MELSRCSRQPLSALTGRVAAGRTRGRGLAAPGLDEVERVGGGSAAQYLPSARITLLSVTRADNGAYAVLECSAGGPLEPLSLERAAVSVGAALDPTLLGERPAPRCG